MARKSQGSSGQRQQDVAKSSESNDVAVLSRSPRIAATAEKEGRACANGRNRINSKSNGNLVAETVYKRLRNLYKKLQRAENSEKKKAAGDQISSEQEALVASIPMLRAVVKELEEIAKTGVSVKADSSKGTSLITDSDDIEDAQPTDSIAEQAISPAEERGRTEATLRENMVHHQTLRLFYAVGEKLFSVPENCVSSIEKSKLTDFYHLLLSTVDFNAVVNDEKFTQPPLAAIKHLRLLAEYSACPIEAPQDALKLDEANSKICYADIARVIDKVISASNSKDEYNLSESKDCTGVKMPKLESMFIHSEEADAQDSDNDFNLQIEVPPGGFNFLATAEVLEDSENEASLSDNNNESASELAAKKTSVSNELHPSIEMPEPVYANESSTDNGQGGRTGNVSDSRVGGFVQPLKVPILSEESTATIGSAKKAVSPATSTAQDITMPMPADNPTGDNAFDGVSVVPAGFVPYLTSSQIASMANWPVFNVPSTAATSGGAVPGMYGGGVVPMPFPPHIAMQYGYVPPQIHGMQPISPAAGIGPPGIGDNSDIGNPKTGAVAASAKDSTGSLPDAIEQQQANHTSHQAVGGNVIQPTAIAPGIRGNPLGEDMWIPANAIAAHHHQGNEQGSQIGTPTPIIAASGLQGMSATPPLAAGSYQYPAMTAAAAAAAAGYSMATPFTYPHVDASSLSTAATGGGSENNDSVNSGDSASNRGNGVPSRPNSMHHYPQLTPDGQRGFAQAVNMNMGMNMGMVDYPQTAPYVWPQQAESYHHPHHQHQHHHQPYAKAMQTAMYAGYSHQNQADNQQQSSFQQPQQQQQQQQQSQLSHGYRRRGSGSNSNNSNNSSSNGGASTSHHSQYSRDRRGHNGNGGYQRQQRWHNNNNSNNSINNGGGSGNSHHRQHNHYSQQG